MSHRKRSPCVEEIVGAGGIMVLERVETYNKIGNGRIMQEKKKKKEEEKKKKRRKKEEKRRKKVVDGGRRCRRRKEIACIPAQARAGGNVEHNREWA